MKNLTIQDLKDMYIDTWEYIEDDEKLLVEMANSILRFANNEATRWDKIKINEFLIDGNSSNFSQIYKALYEHRYI